MKDENISVNLREEDLIDLAWGLGHTSSGGGGGFAQTFKLVNYLKDNGFIELPVYKQNALTKDEVAILLGGLGQPSAVQGDKILKFIELCQKAFDYHKSVINPKTTAITPVEAATLNTFLSICVAHLNSSIKLIDVDGAGRAVPSLTNLLFDLEEISFAPGVSYGIKADADVKEHDLSWQTGAQAEKGLGGILQELGGAMGITAWEQNGDKLSTASLNSGFIKDAIVRGKDIRKNANSLSNLYSYFSNSTINPFGGYTILTKLNDIVEDEDTRFDRGYLTFDYDEKTEGRVYYLNENLIVALYNKETGKFDRYHATAPSSITCYFDDPDSANEFGLQIQPGENALIPYNTGDLDKIRSLIGKEMLLVVSPPNALLYEPEPKKRFVEQMIASIGNRYGLEISEEVLVPPFV